MATITETSLEESYRNALNAAAEQAGLPTVNRPTLQADGVKWLIKDPLYGMTEIVVGHSGLLNIRTFTNRKNSIKASERAGIAHRKVWKR